MSNSAAVPPPALVVNAYNQYKFERPDLTPDQFRELLRIFPVILVLQADSFIDSIEMQFLLRMANHYLLPNIPGTTETQLKQEIRYLVFGAKTWREPFLDALHQALTERYLGGAEIVEMMIEACGASAGSITKNVLLSTLNPDGQTNLGSSDLRPENIQAQFIDNAEKKVLLDISSRLGFMNQPELAARLQLIL